MKNWTKEQNEAIQSRNCNLLLSAAAGSGKTAVLVERIIQIILKDKIDIDKLLIVTFTNAAAGEMRERISDAIVRELETPGESEDHLRRQMTLLNKASIMTIHAFCIELVKGHFHLIDIDPNFRVGDITETRILQLDALEELFEEEYKKGDPTFIGLVERFGGTREDTALQNLTLKTYNFVQSQPKPYQWLKERVEDFNLDINDFEQSQWFQIIRNRIKVSLENALNILEEAREKCCHPRGPLKYLEAIDDDIRQVNDLCYELEKGIVNFHHKIKDFKNKRLTSAKQEVDESIREEVKFLRDMTKNIVKDIKVDICALSPSEYVEDINKLYPYMVYLCKMVEDFAKEYRQKKAERTLLDFNDLEHYALEILENEHAVEEYRERFHYIFIDEYQDSNMVQETLIQSIKRSRNIFMVGDVKQSIYRFRLADPTLFIKKYESFKEEEGSPDRKINLSKNFRSRKEILEGTNFIFKNIMSESLGEIDYNEEAYLLEGRDFKPIEDPSIELNIIERDVESDDIQELGDIEVEAQIVVNRIKKLLQEKIYDSDKKEYRPIEYKDIVVLMRTTQNWAEIFLETFIQESIPVYADINTGYFEAVEIKIFMNLLKIIDNKRQDLPLISVMRSPIGRFTVEELMEIRIEYKDGSFFDALEFYKMNCENSLAKKINTFLQELDQWSEKAKFMKVDEFIWKLLIDTGYFYYVGAMPGGQQKQANLRVLLDRASQFEKTSIKGLFSFINFVEKLENSRGDMGAAKILSENDNVIRIMSIHKSKGLEFPVVIIAGLGKNFNLMDINSDVLMHKDLGLGPRFVDVNLRTYRDTIARLAMREKIKIENLSEEMRILYVAMTRAIDKLILLGSIKKITSQAEKWARGISLYTLASAKSYLDWLGMALIKHPDGQPIRKAMGLTLTKEDLIKDQSLWNISVCNRQDIILREKERNEDKNKIRQELTSFESQKFSPFKEKINSIFDWRYPHLKATAIPSKLTVTQIKKSTIDTMESIGYNIPNLVKRPKFMEGTRVFSAAERGTVLHFVLQHLDFKEASTYNNIKDQVKAMIMRELLTEEEASILDISKINALLESELGKRIVKAKRVYKEASFNLRKKARDVIDGLYACDEILLIQGTIDCYFEEDGQWVLVDYKSDKITNNDISKVIKNYEVQLDIYKEALEKTTKKNVKESYIYLFDIDRAVQL